MSETFYPNIINGQHVPAETGKTLPITNPATGESLGSFAASGVVDVHAAVEAAQTARHGKWGRMTAAQRARILNKTARLLEERMKDIAQIESMNMGKPVMHVSGEIRQAIANFEYMAGAANVVGGIVPPIHGAFHGYTLKEPVGVVGAITPWNYPLMLASWKLAPALAAGCTVVLKPSEWTPITANMLVEILHEAGLPEGVCNVVHGLGEDAGAALVKHPAVQKIAFTGGTETGKAIMKTAADSVKRVMLELGGKSPAIVCDDAALHDAILTSVFTIFYAAGQSCEARSRIYVQDSVYEEFVESFVTATKKLKVGDPLDKNTHVGALAHESRVRIMDDFVKSAQEDGGKILCGGHRLTEGGFAKGAFYAPTVIVDLPHTSRCVQEEIFGPIVVISRFKNDAEAIQLANDVKYGLAATLWTNDLTRAHKLINAMQAGIVTVNTPATALPGLPFGGYKQSGFGREMALETLGGYFETKSVLIGTTGKPSNPFGIEM